MKNLQDPYQSLQDLKEEEEEEEKVPDTAINFYAVLNLEKTATEEDIRNAYKKLVISYHPDKYQDERLKQSASNKFQVIQKAYDTLSDPNRRYLYDLYGVDEPWELGPKLKSKEEIQEEYERRMKFKKEMEEHSLVRSKGHLVLGLDATPIIFGLESCIIPPLSHALVVHSWETRLSDFTDLSLSGHVLSKNGIGAGSINATLRHNFSSTLFSEATLMASQEPSLQFKLTKNLSGDSFVNSTLVLKEQPSLNAMFGMKLTDTMTGFIMYEPQLWEDTSCTIGMWSHKERSSWNYEIRAGTSSHINMSYTKWISKSYRGKIGVFVAQNNIKVTLGGDTKVYKATRAGMQVDWGSTGVTWSFKISRLGQKLSIPVFLTPDADLKIAFFAIAGPLSISWAVDELLLKKWRKVQKQKQILELRQLNQEMLKQKKQEAEEAIELMKETVNKKISFEKNKDGLLIQLALYGKLPPSQNVSVRAFSTQGIKQTVDSVVSAFSPSFPSDEYVDVTIPVQSLVNNSQLFISGGHSKSNLLGFSDPCFGEDKRLRIIYSFQGRQHEVEVSDTEGVACPLRAHIISQ